jgi:hypothetical protein
MQGTYADLSNLTHRANVVLSVHAYFVGGDDDGFGSVCRQAGRYAFDRGSGYQRREPGPLRAHLRAYLDALRPAGIPRAPQRREGVKAVMAADDPAAILAIGDFQHPSISSIDDGFDLIFGSDAGAGRPTIYPTAGPTQDVTSCTDRAYEDHWGRSAITGHSFDLGSWHSISLPSAVYRYGCDTAGVLDGLTADLVADPKPARSPSGRTRTGHGRPRATRGAERQAVGGGALRP